jgi:hypothetical protein
MKRVYEIRLRDGSTVHLPINEGENLWQHVTDAVYKSNENRIGAAVGIKDIHSVEDITSSTSSIAKLKCEQFGIVQA